MTNLDLLTTRKDGPLSSIFLVQVTSIIREAALASHGFWKVPTPLEPSGQSARGAGSAALGAGVGVGAGAGAWVRVGFAEGAVALACSCSQPERPIRRVTNRGNVCFALDMAASLRALARSRSAERAHPIASPP